MRKLDSCSKRVDAGCAAPCLRPTERVRCGRLDRLPCSGSRIAVWSESSAGAGVPGRSREQRLRALEQADEVRTARAELKRELAAGKIELAAILADPPPCARTARVRDLLVALPRIGAVRAGHVLGHCGIAHSKTLGGLTDRQRGALISLLRD